MDKLSSALKWLVRLGVAGGVTYIVVRENIFGSQKDTFAAYSRFRSRAADGGEYFSIKAPPGIPPELAGRARPDPGPGNRSQLRRSHHRSPYQQGFVNHWNAGVTAFFSKLASLPERARAAARKGSEGAKGLVEKARKKARGDEDGDEEQ